MISISIGKAKKSKLFYFVATGVIYRENDGRCLILKRSQEEITHPGLWTIVGGKLEWEDFKEEKITRWNHDIPNWENLIEELLFREAKEESGLEVEDPRYLSSVGFIRPDGVPVVCPKFALKYKSGEVKIAHEFDDFAWVNSKEIKGYEIIKGIDNEIQKTIEIYAKH